MILTKLYYRLLSSKPSKFALFCQNPILSSITNLIVQKKIIVENNNKRNDLILIWMKTNCIYEIYIIKYITKDLDKTF